jgi:peptide/nickel transport system ATP-binding protein
MALLEVDGLITRFDLAPAPFDVVDGATLEVAAGETVGLVGESGSGKSLTLRSIVHALPPKASIAGGRIVFDGQDVTKPSRRALRRIRGRGICMIFQDPLAALNPVLTIGDQMGETLRLTAGVRGEKARRTRAVELLRLVGVPEPERRLRAYPHELSGGMAQRVVIALALIGEPRVLLADEPTSALDVTVQAQILRLLVDLQQRFGMAVVLVSHDFGVVAQTCRRVYVMYGGRVVEEAQVAELFEHPRHPYTAALLECIPTLDAERPDQLPAIPGSPPDLAAPPAGCRFHPRCPLTIDRCLGEDVRLLAVGEQHRAACIRHDVVTRATVAVAAADTEAS